MQISTSIIKTGRFYEVFYYKYPIQIGDKKTLRDSEIKIIKNNHEDINEESARVSASRARNKLKRLTLGNMWETKERLKFITLTFKKEIENLNEANYLFKLFRQKLSYRIGKNLEYIAVPEIQEKRAKRTGKRVWHYHAMTFNLPYLPHNELVDLWGNRAEVQQVRKELDSVGYLTKYFSKTYQNRTLKGKKRYYQSLLHQPQKIREKEEVQQTLSLLAGYCPHEEFQYTPMVNAQGRVLQEVTKREYLIP